MTMIITTNMYIFAGTHTLSLPVKGNELGAVLKAACSKVKKFSNDDILVVYATNGNPLFFKLTINGLNVTPKLLENHIPTVPFDEFSSKKRVASSMGKNEQIVTTYINSLLCKNIVPLFGKQLPEDYQIVSVNQGENVKVSKQTLVMVCSQLYNGNYFDLIAYNSNQYVYYSMISAGNMRHSGDTYMGKQILVHTMNGLSAGCGIALSAYIRDLSDWCSEDRTPLILMYDPIVNTVYIVPVLLSIESLSTTEGTARTIMPLIFRKSDDNSLEAVMLTKMITSRNITSSQTTKHHQRQQFFGSCYKKAEEFIGNNIVQNNSDIMNDYNFIDTLTLPEKGSIITSGLNQEDYSKIQTLFSTVQTVGVSTEMPHLPIATYDIEKNDIFMYTPKSHEMQNFNVARSGNVILVTNQVESFVQSGNVRYPIVLIPVNNDNLKNVPLTGVWSHLSYGSPAFFGFLNTTTGKVFMGYGTDIDGLNFDKPNVVRHFGEEIPNFIQIVTNWLNGQNQRRMITTQTNMINIHGKTFTHDEFIQYVTNELRLSVDHLTDQFVRFQQYLSLASMNMSPSDLTKLKMTLSDIIVPLSQSDGLRKAFLRKWIDENKNESPAGAMKAWKQHAQTSNQQIYRNFENMINQLSNVRHIDNFSTFETRSKGNSARALLRKQQINTNVSDAKSKTMGDIINDIFGDNEESSCAMITSDIFNQKTLGTIPQNILTYEQYANGLELIPMALNERCAYLDTPTTAIMAQNIISELCGQWTLPVPIYDDDDDMDFTKTSFAILANQQKYSLWRIKVVEYIMNLLGKDYSKDFNTPRHLLVAFLTSLALKLPETNGTDGTISRLSKSIVQLIMTTWGSGLRPLSGLYRILSVNYCSEFANAQQITPYEWEVLCVMPKILKNSGCKNEVIELFRRNVRFLIFELMTQAFKGEFEQATAKIKSQKSEMKDEQRRMSKAPLICIRCSGHTYGGELRQHHSDTENTSVMKTCRVCNQFKACPNVDMCIDCRMNKDNCIDDDEKWFISVEKNEQAVRTIGCRCKHVETAVYDIRSNDVITPTEGDMSFTMDIVPAEVNKQLEKLTSNNLRPILPTNVNACINLTQIVGFADNTVDVVNNISQKMKTILINVRSGKTTDRREAIMDVL